MTRAELLAALASHGIQVRGDPTGRIVLYGRPADLSEGLTAACREHRWLLVWGLHGIRGGHVWLACDLCGEVQLVRPDRKGTRCKMTFACEGRLAVTPVPWFVPLCCEGRTNVAS